jgi:hypothetical protein
LGRDLYLGPNLYLDKHKSLHELYFTTFSNKNGRITIEPKKSYNNTLPSFCIENDFNIIICVYTTQKVIFKKLFEDIGIKEDNLISEDLKSRFWRYWVSLDVYYFISAEKEKSYEDALDKISERIIPFVVKNKDLIKLSEHL